MMKKKKILNIALAVIFVLFFLVSNSLYILDQRKIAIITQFGEVISQKTSPGLKYKIPFIQTVIFFDKRLQNMTFNMNDFNEVVALDQKTLKLDAYAKYKIIDPKSFYESVQNNEKFRTRLGSIVESSIREVIGQVKFIDILGEKRNVIHEKIVSFVNEDAKNFGVNVVDVRLVRVNLPDKAREAVYNRMRTEREKEAKEIRAIGQQESDVIRATAEKEERIFIAEAEKKSEIIKGQGDAKAITIYANSFGKDKEFFEYYRSLEAYKKVFNNAAVYISSDNPFLKYMNKK